MELLINFTLSFFLSLISLVILRKLSLRLSIIKSDKNIPLLGGIGFSLSIFALFLFHYLLSNIILPSQLVNILIFAYAILIIELFDDWHEFSLLKKTFIQIIAVGLFLLNGKKIQIYFLPQWLNYLISFLWIMGITNAFNLLDIKDGLCSGISLIIAITFGVVSIICNDIISAYIFFILSGALLAFYIFNLPPAKMYMGNSGSHFLGFLFASLSIHLDYATLKNVGALFSPIIILAFPILDTLFLVFARIRKKMLPLRKSNDHIFLKLLSKNVTYQNALAAVYLITIGWCLTAIFLLLEQNIFFLSFFILSSLLTLLIIHKAKSYQS